MKVRTVTYEMLRRRSGVYENDRVSSTVELGPKDTPEQATRRAKSLCGKALGLDVNVPRSPPNSVASKNDFDDGWDQGWDF